MQSIFVGLPVPFMPEARSQKSEVRIRNSETMFFCRCEIAYYKGKEFVMKKLIFVLMLALVAGCDVQSGISKKSVEKYMPTPTPTMEPTPTEEPINPADVVNVDTAQQGPLLSVNGPNVTKTINCDRYNRVMVNSDGNKVTIKGACNQVMVNGDENEITAEATMEFVFNGTGNNATYSKFANGKRPRVTDNLGGNLAEKADAVADKKDAK